MPKNSSELFTTNTSEQKESIKANQTEVSLTLPIKDLHVSYTSMEFVDDAGKKTQIDIPVFTVDNSKIATGLAFSNSLFSLNESVESFINNSEELKGVPFYFLNIIVIGKVLYVRDPKMCKYLISNSDQLSHMDGSSSLAKLIGEDSLILNPDHHDEHRKNLRPILMNATYIQTLQKYLDQLFSKSLKNQAIEGGIDVKPFVSSIVSTSAVHTLFSDLLSEAQVLELEDFIQSSMKSFEKDSLLASIPLFGNPLISIKRNATGLMKERKAARKIIEDALITRLSQNIDFENSRPRRNSSKAKSPNLEYDGLESPIIDQMIGSYVVNDLKINSSSLSSTEIENLVKKHLAPMVDQLMSLVLASMDTTTGYLSSILLELSQNPEVFTRLSKSLEGVTSFNEKDVRTGDSSHKLNELFRFLYAVLHKLPPTFMGARKTNQEMSVQGWTIPTDTTIFMDLKTASTRDILGKNINHSLQTNNGKVGEKPLQSSNMPREQELLDHNMNLLYLYPHDEINVFQDIAKGLPFFYGDASGENNNSCLGRLLALSIAARFVIALMNSWESVKLSSPEEVKEGGTVTFSLQNCVIEPTLKE